MLPLQRGAGVGMHTKTCAHKAPTTIMRSDALSPIVHTKTPENADENEDFRKRFQKWRLLKTHRFENASFLVWSVENGDF